ncbi:MAG: 2-isopropylmalate synthase [Moraxellaceae bacterium]|nr:MAG: 2-isopropylmalate synthase [Moraxellaceae bacterium]
MTFNHQKYKPFHPIQKPDRKWPNQQITQAPKWCAVDLRDGNQALIEPMNVDQKIDLFLLLVKCGFKEIEVGFPAASQPDFDFVRKIIEDDLIPSDVCIQALTQARETLVERTFEALRGTKKAVVHVYNSTSPVQREQVFGLDKKGIKDIAIAGATMLKDTSKKYSETQWRFEYSPESFSATEPEFALEICNAVLDVWKPNPSQRAIINLPSTVECTTPNVYADQIEFMHERIDYREWIDISVHTHNDRGCAVAAAELAIMAGADRVEGTLLGNGERTGNMDIITMAMNLYTQGIDPELYLANMDEIIRTVKDCTQLPVHPRHPWAGELVFTAFSGSHQDAINKCLQQRESADAWNVAYLPIDPKDLGRSYQEIIRVNSQSGKGGAAFILQNEYGLQMPRWMQLAFSPVVQQATENHRGVLDTKTLHSLFFGTFAPAQPWALERYSWDDQQGLTATVTCDNQTFNLSGKSDGPLHALISAMSDQCGQVIEIQDYKEHAIHQDGLDTKSNAQAAAYVSLKVNGENAFGVAIATDTLGAALRACLSAINSAINAGGNSAGDTTQHNTTASNKTSHSSKSNPKSLAPTS